MAAYKYSKMQQDTVTYNATLSYLYSNIQPANIFQANISPQQRMKITERHIHSSQSPACQYTTPSSYFVSNACESISQHYTEQESHACNDISSA